MLAHTPLLTCQDLLNTDNIPIDSRSPLPYCLHRGEESLEDSYTASDSISKQSAQLDMTSCSDPISAEVAAPIFEISPTVHPGSLTLTDPDFSQISLTD